MEGYLNKPPAPQPDQLIGRVIAQRYEIIALLGEGGMSAVYKARHRVLDRMLAVKVMHSHLNIDQNYLQRFQQEAQTVSTLDHPNIVRIHDFGQTEEGRAYLVMDFLDGTNLARSIQQQELDAKESLHILMQLCDGLHHAHSKNVVHRDLKPSNIILVQNNTAKIVDFGIAKVVAANGSDLQKLTRTGEVFGSPLYMSPEQCTGKRIDERSDIYSFGCLMFELFTGHPPFVGQSVYETITHHLEQPPPPLTQTLMPVPNQPVLEAIICKCLAKDPSDRYQTMLELKDALKEASPERRRSFLSRTTQNLMAYVQRAALRGRFKAAAQAHAVAAAAIIALVLSTSLLAALIANDIPGLPSPEMISQSDAPETKKISHRQFAEIEADLRRSVQATESDRDVSSHLAALEKLGSFYSTYGHFTSAIAAHEQRLAIEKRESGGRHTLDLMHAYLRLADAYYWNLQPEKALPLYLEAINLISHTISTRSELLVEPELHVAQIYYRSGQPSEALRLYEYLKRIYADIDYSGTSQESIRFSIRLADLNRIVGKEKGDYGRLMQAESIYSQVYSYLAKVSGTKRKELAMCSFGLALTLSAEQKTDRAESYFHSAIDTAKEAFGANSPYTLAMMQHYARFLWHHDRFVDALIIRAQTRIAALQMKR